ncbi:MAG: MXAN_5187 C-terminal domain-containing protein [Myxococcota bacterium]
MEVLTQDEELKLLEVKLNQLKLDYEKYFIGNRPTEPAQLRSDVQKTMIKWSNTRITNSALRFKFNSLNGRYQAFKRQWDGVLRQIEAGTYKRHVFKADLHDRERGVAPSASETPLQATGAAIGAGAEAGAAAGGAKTTADGRKEGAGSAPAPARAGGADLFEAYRSALQSAGQDTSGLSRAKLTAVLAKQEAELQKKLGCEKVSFKVVVQDGKVKLKAAAG